MTASSDARTLAAALAALDDAELARVLARRGVSPEAGWHDFFDAADALLAGPAVDRALTALSRRSLLALAAGRPAPALREGMLLRPDGTAYATVAARLRERLDGAPLSDAAAAGPAVASPTAEAAAAERAFTAMAALSDVLLRALSAPIARTGAGPVSMTDRKRLIEAGAVADAEELDDLVTLGEAAGLLRDVDRHWQATAAAETWLDSSTAERWSAIATAFQASLRPGLRTAEGGHLAAADWADAYPLDEEWPALAALLRRRAWRVGILADGDAEPSWSRGLRERGEPGLALLVGLLPAEIDRVYLQADLTAIAPGPLHPALEQRLRTMATRESRAQASSYRFSADSLAAAVAAGETAASLLAFLGELSLTGVPQPLAYLIDRVTARHGLMRVGSDPATGRTVVTSEDPDLLAAAGVDQALRLVGLVPHEGSLVSRASRDAVYWALADARYPVVAQDADGAVQALGRRVAPPAPAAGGDLERYARLVHQLRGAQGPDAEAAWLERELEQAVRTRAPIAVTVRLPDASARTFVLEATGLGGGRLRGRDRDADVERTLPLSSIESVRSA